MPEVPEVHHKPSGNTIVKVEGSSNDEKYSSMETVVEEPVAVGTKVTVERGGQVVSTDVYNDKGSLQRKKVGRNDPCWCGREKKKNISLSPNKLRFLFAIKKEIPKINKSIWIMAFLIA